eukprot:Skav236660  [mRNA]  locus=scaffold3354:75121:80933:+ [translate_table: standard]
MLGIWVASFGGALHAPVTTYFQVEAEIGNFGVIRTVGVLLVSPLYGWLLDRHSAYTPAVPCLATSHPGVEATETCEDLRAEGIITVWNVVGAYVALATPREQRHVVVTGFQAAGLGLQQWQIQVCYQHLATMAVPPAHQGRIFSLLNVLSSLGNILGNLVATRFSEHETAFYSRGSFPFLVTSSLFCTMGCSVVGFLCVPMEELHHPKLARVVGASDDAHEHQ